MTDDHDEERELDTKFRPLVPTRRSTFATNMAISRALHSPSSSDEFGVFVDPLRSGVSFSPPAERISTPPAPYLDELLQHEEHWMNANRSGSGPPDLLTDLDDEAFTKPIPIQRRRSSMSPSSPARLARPHSVTDDVTVSSSVGESASQWMTNLIRTNSSNPFGSKFYTPPTGAPGYAGEEHRWNTRGFSDSLEVEDVRLLGRKESTAGVLDDDLSRWIRAKLPALARLPKTWTLLYSLDQHGISLHTLYTRCETSTNGALLVIKDSGETRFGVWLGEPLRPSKGSYYGGGEAFMWRHFDGEFQVYKWSTRNEYVALCEPEFLSFGGGEGAYGLYVDSSLLDGSSAPCPTFENAALCSPGVVRVGGSVDFDCVGLEVWQVG